MVGFTMSGFPMYLLARLGLGLGLDLTLSNVLTCSRVRVLTCSAASLCILTHLLTHFVYDRTTMMPAPLPGEDAWRPTEEEIRHTKGKAVEDAGGTMAYNQAMSNLKMQGSYCSDVFALPGLGLLTYYPLSEPSKPSKPYTN